MRYILLLSLSACSLGVPREAVMEATTTIKTQVQLAQAALVKCRQGDVDLCIQIDHNLVNIDELNMQLQGMAGDQ